MKKENQQLVEWHIRSQLRGVHIKKPVRLIYRWYEANRKRDLDNVAGFGHKICQDAMVKCRVIENDGWNYITGFADEFYLDTQSPRIEIDIIEN